MNPNEIHYLALTLRLDKLNLFEASYLNFLRFTLTKKDKYLPLNS